MREVLFLVTGAMLTMFVFFGLSAQKADAPVAQTAAVATTSVSLSESPQSPQQAEKTKTYRVVKVVDGDTVTVEKDGTNVTLRLIGLDTPETVDPRKPVQCFGKEASDKAKELLTNSSIAIETDDSQGTYDKYDRLLAYIYLQDGTNFNAYMIEQGYGHEYTYDLPYKYQTAFRAAQARAKLAQKGLWNPDVCKTMSVPTVPATAPVNTGQYACSKNAYNCSSFKTHTEAQAVFESCGGPANDVHKLDSDRDGSVCESLP